MKIIDAILDFLFPYHCLICGKDGHFVCKNCSEKIIPLQKQVCPVCKKISLHGATCKYCKNKTNLDGMIVWASYNQNPILKKLVGQTKYTGYRNTFVILGNLLIRRFNQEHIGKAVLVPVPLHWYRWSIRWFNQAEVLTWPVKDKNSVENILVRTRYTTPQVRVASRKKRLNNLKNAFKCTKDLRGRDEIFVLVDDVSSTGATLEDCARALKEAGAKKVYGLVLARG